ncbi:MAG TPA: hypothetical protein VFW62_04945, partial [bacterium]|nr:hypothetical protein [bacterium]
NGICEGEQGEDCDTCAIDCNPPGYDAACLDQAEADLICVDAPSIKLIEFPGPPYPDSGQFPGELCEDGDLCTDNVCETGGSCVITDKACEPDADFCCPSGCAAPAPGGTCREVTGAPIPGCDPDCYVPEECPILIPTPTPTPTPPANPLLEGSGCSLGGLASSASAWAWLSGFGLLAAFGIRRRS